MSFSKEEIKKSMLLYAITDRTWLREGESLAGVTERVLKNGATFLQLREKDLPRDAVLRLAHTLRALAASYHVPFVVNDDVDAALACGADGVHVGQSDIMGRDVRALIGPDKVLGISANTVETAQSAQAAGADYIGVGAVFATATKKDAGSLTLEELRAICAAVDLPVVAIGGIGPQNISALAGSGVDGVAVVSALYGSSDPGAAAAQLLGLARAMVAAHE